MSRWVNDNQEAHWDRRRFYRDARDPAAEAFARPKIEWLAMMLGIAPGATVLDVGAGTGMFTWWWTQYGARVTGLELSENMIQRSACPELMQIGNAYDLPFEDDTFDVTFAGNLLHHLEQPERALREMARCARSGIAIVECNRNHPPMAAFGAVSSVCRGLLTYTRKSLTDMATDAGLEVIGAELHGYVYENRSPRASLPVARRLEHVLPGGAYVMLAARPRYAAVGGSGSSAVGASS
jgi:ubiquinone/menaquinone biosynthesis C-methylase UbiE